MCILFIAVQQHPTFPLIIAANRDEFYKRPTHPSHFWSESPELLAGKDLEAGGTWMGMTRFGDLSALTNIRAPHLIKDDAKSRGSLVYDFLMDEEKKQQYVSYLHQSREEFNGYNLLFGKWNDLAVYNNHEDSLQYLHPGFYGLSNANLNSPWPKINKGVQALRNYCKTHDEMDDEQLFELLRNEEKAKDHLLPVTGVPEQWEKQLSSVFINVEGYGTRSSTLLYINNEGEVHWHERSWDDQANHVEDRRFSFTLESKA